MAVTPIFMARIDILWPDNISADSACLLMDHVDIPVGSGCEEEGKVSVADSLKNRDGAKCPAVHDAAADYRPRG